VYATLRSRSCGRSPKRRLDKWKYYYEVCAYKSECSGQCNVIIKYIFGDCNVTHLCTGIARSATTKATTWDFIQQLCTYDVVYLKRVFSSSTIFLSVLLSSTSRHGTSIAMVRFTVWQYIYRKYIIYLRRRSRLQRRDHQQMACALIIEAAACPVSTCVLHVSRVQQVAYIFHRSTWPGVPPSDVLF
jgi:hypothetical protein